MIELRDYQQDAMDIILKSIPSDENLLLQAATGSGKTIIFCKLIETILINWPEIRIGIITHRRELVTQAYNKLLKVWPEAPIGIACASVSTDVNVDMPVTIGTIQTIVNRTDGMKKINLIIIDEAHRIPPKNIPSQFLEFINKAREANPKVRILGVTATPFRLGHGYIYGKRHKPGNKNLFEKLHYGISIKNLQDMDFLCRYRAKEIKNMDAALSGIKVSGDYNIGQLSDEMIKKHHVGSAVEAVNEHCKSRRHIVVFAVTIAHAEEIQKAFVKVGHSCAVLHSKLHIRLRDMALAGFASGKINIIVNVGILTEGWDSPHTDCIVMCRPTKSAGLYVQMTGRGLRPNPGKTDVLILDLAGNCRQHGDPNDPVVEYPSKKSASTGAPMKVCKGCKEMVPISCSVCPMCGYEFPIREVETVTSRQTLSDVKWGSSISDRMVVSITDHTFQRMVSKAGNEMMKLNMTCQGPGLIMKYFVNDFFDFEGSASLWSRDRARAKWVSLVGTPPPATLDEAEGRIGEIAMSLPDEIEIIQKGHFWNVASWKVSPWNKGELHVNDQN